MARQTNVVFDAVPIGVIANGLGFDRMASPDERKAGSHRAIAGLVPPASIGCLVAWRFSSLIAGDRRAPPPRL